MGMGNAPLTPLEQPVTGVHGVGPERAALLARLGIATVGDLLLHRPRRHEDRRRLERIAALKLNESATTQGRIVAQGVKYWKQRRMSLFECVLDDGTGRLHCRWWNLPFMENYFKVGDEVLVYGKVRSLKPRAIDHPETETIESGDERSIHLHRIVPIYPLTEGLTQRWFRGLIWRGLEAYGSAFEEPWPSLDPGGLPMRAAAVRQIHFPDEMDDAEAARGRLALDELIELQLAIQRRRRRLHEHARALPCGGDNRLMKRFLGSLGFKLTEAQTGVLREIRRDLAGSHPMRRLLQGDVGSGKTVVAACAALMTLESGFNVALMAPTEILAEQHGCVFARWFGPLGLGVAMQTGSQKTFLTAPAGQIADSLAGPGDAKDLSERGAALAGPAVTVGTHALVEAGYCPDALGLVIIDEQHKFGVAQRERLVRKGRYPHLLVMTATPIPRTLGLTLYGDLDISVISQMPAGRGRVRTYLRSESSLPKVWGFVRQKLGEGRQAYIVCPRIEERDGPAAVKTVREEFDRVRTLFAPHAVGLLHGRLPPREKDRVMEGFRAGRIAVLVATSVIEVGVDVPNATIMVVENAESYGLAQLHQLRGRIGRGREESHCILIAAARTDEARRRLEALEETNDGFRIAETDLLLRGPGEFLGQAQSGMPRFRFVELARDLALVERARTAAAGLLDSGAA